MANEFAHVTVGTELTQAEYELITGHQFNAQATGDTLYASSATQLSRLGIGSAGAPLVTNDAGTLPAWSTRVLHTAGAFAFQEATAISTTAGALTLTPNTDVVIANGKGLLVGNATGVLVSGVQSEFQILGTGEVDSTGVIYRASADANGPELRLAKTRAATIGGAASAIQAGDSVGMLRWVGDDGSDIVSTTAYIGVVAQTVFQTDDTHSYMVFAVSSDGAKATEKFRLTGEAILTSLGAIPTNITGAGAGVFGGGVAFTDVANAWIDDATHGTGTVVHYIGNETIDTTASDVRLKSNFALPGLLAREHLSVLAEALEEYDFAQEGGRYTGHVAQRLYDVLPQYVVKGAAPEDIWSVKYKYMVGPLLWGWHDHEGRLARLEQENQELRALVAGRRN